MDALVVSRLARLGTRTVSGTDELVLAPGEGLATETCLTAAFVKVRLAVTVDVETNVVGTASPSTRICEDGTKPEPVMDTRVAGPAGATVGETEVTIAGRTATTLAVPDFVPSCVEVALIVAVPAPLGVKIPAEVTVPPVADQDTAELNAPVPCTVAAHEDVPVMRIEPGEQETDTDVMVTGTVTPTVAAPDLVLSWADVAVIVAVPEAVGVKTPVVETEPPVADQETAEP
jgi:hypothetical protein